MDIGKTIGRIFISILLIISLIGFSATYSVSEHITGDKVSEIASSVVKDIAKEKILEQVNERAIDEGKKQIDVEAVHKDLIEECDKIGSLDVEDYSISLDCDRIRETNPADLEEALKEELEKVIDEGVESEFENQGLNERIEEISRYVSLINVGVWVFGIFSLIMVFVLFLLSVPKYKFAIDLGFVGLIAGAPYFIVKNLNIRNFEINVLNALVKNIQATLSSSLLIIFSLGIVFLVIGFVWDVIYRRTKTKKQILKQTRSSRK